VVEVGSRQPDVVIVDLGLPDMDGLDVIRRMREWTDIPVIVLSARGGERDKVTALDAGADDYVSKPFSAGELLARIRVALRHTAGASHETDDAVFQVGSLRVDLLRRQVFVDDKEIRLTPIEYKLLTTLVHYAGKVVTHQQLLRECGARRTRAGPLRAGLHGAPAPEARGRAGAPALSAHGAGRRVSTGGGVTATASTRPPAARRAAAEADSGSTPTDTAPGCRRL
jgi:hypothetical protein